MNYSIFAQTRDPRSKDQANVFWNGEYPLYSLTSDKQILPNGSGEFIFWGTTNEKPEPTEYKLTKGQTKYVYKFIDYQECILFCNEIRKGKGMQLLEISSIPNRIRWEAKGKTIIEKNLNQEWLESSNGNTFIYNQISSDERGILLQDKNRNGVFIYLENDKCHYKDLNTDWVIIYYGNWIGNNQSNLANSNLSTANSLGSFSFPSSFEIFDKELNSKKDINQEKLYANEIIRDNSHNSTEELVIKIIAKIRLIEIQIGSDPALTSTMDWKNNFDFLKLLIDKETFFNSFNDAIKANFYYKLIYCGKYSSSDIEPYIRKSVNEFNSENYPLGQKLYDNFETYIRELDNNGIVQNKSNESSSSNIIKSKFSDIFTKIFEEEKERVKSVYINGTGCVFCMASGECQGCSNHSISIGVKSGNCYKLEYKNGIIGYNICLTCKGTKLKLQKNICGCNNSVSPYCAVGPCDNASCNNGWIRCKSCNGTGKCTSCTGTGKGDGLNDKNLFFNALTH